MKVEITEKGVRREGKEIAVGEVITVSGDTMPAGLVNKARIVFGGGKTAVTNPAKGALPNKTTELTAEAESLGIEVDGRWSDKRIQDEIDKKLGE